MATPANPPAQPQLPEEMYGMFCGEINQITSQKFVNVLAIAGGGKVKHVHLLFQTAGGYIGDGVFLYNLFRSIPIELTLYNVGQIASAGVVAYLGANGRKTSQSATFMVHKGTNSAQFATASTLQKLADGLILDDQRIEKIIRDHVNFPPELWEKLNHSDVYLSGQQALEDGIADEIREFSPPAGVHVFNILA